MPLSYTAPLGPRQAQTRSEPVSAARSRSIRRYPAGLVTRSELSTTQACPSPMGETWAVQRPASSKASSGFVEVKTSTSLPARGCDGCRPGRRSTL